MSRRKQKLSSPHSEEPAQRASRPPKLAQRAKEGRTGRPQAKPEGQPHGSRRSFSAPHHAADGDSRKRDDAFRTVNRVLGAYRYCAKPRCRRAQDCTGDAAACFGVFFRAWPEETKDWFRAFLVAWGKVNDKQKAVKIASERMAQRAEIAARFDSIRHPEAAAKPPSKGDGQKLEDPVRASFEARPSDEHLRMTAKRSAQAEPEWAKSRNSGPQDQITGPDPSPSGGQTDPKSPKIRAL